MKNTVAPNVSRSGALGMLRRYRAPQWLAALAAGVVVSTATPAAWAQGAAPNVGTAGAGGTALGGSGGQAGAGSAAAGEKKATMCIGCHGIPDYQASFPEVYHVPKIAGQNAKYIQSALSQYRKGDRKHPTMRAVAGSLTDQDIADLAAFYATEAKADPAPAALQGTVPANVAAVLQKGNCASCHGVNFSAPIDPSYPKLAGQHGDYLYIALREYQTDKNPQVGRNNAIMSGMARVLSHDDAKLLAGYISSLPTELKTIPQSRWR